MIFTTNKSLKPSGPVRHDGDLAQGLLDRVFERGRLSRLDGPSVRTLQFTHHQRVRPAEGPKGAAGAAGDEVGKRVTNADVTREARGTGAARLIDGCVPG
jgi:hypothetical protein